jgi:hypothetical protein
MWLAENWESVGPIRFADELDKQGSAFFNQDNLRVEST